MLFYILCLLLPLTLIRHRCWYGQSFFVTIHMTNLSSSYSIDCVQWAHQITQFLWCDLLLSGCLCLLQFTHLLTWLVPPSKAFLLCPSDALFHFFPAWSHLYALQADDLSFWFNFYRLQRNRSCWYWHKSKMNQDETTQREPDVVDE